MCESVFLRACVRARIGIHVCVCVRPLTIHQYRSQVHRVGLSCVHMCVCVCVCVLFMCVCVCERERERERVYERVRVRACA